MKIKQFSIAVCIGTMFTACGSKDDFSAETERQHVRINASIKGMQTRSSGDANQIQNDNFLDGAKINVYLEDYQEGTNLAGVPADPGYLVYTKGATGWTTTVSDVFWNSNAIDAYGIYPIKDVDDNTIDKNATNFRVNEAQVDDADYRMSDLMYAYNRASKGAPIDLEFEHCLSKITVILDPTSTYTVDELKANMDWIQIDNIVLNASLSFSGNTLKATGVGDPINDYVNEVDFGNKEQAEALCSTGISCIIPPQTVAEGTKLFNLCYNVDWMYYYTVPTGGLKFEAGKEYVFNLKLGNENAILAAPTVKSWTVVNRDQETMK